MKRKPSIKSLEGKLTKLAREYVFERDKSTCQKCGRVVEGSNRHPSHCVPKSRSYLLRFDHNNIKTLCMHHHTGWWHLHPTESGIWFKDKFSKRFEYQEKLKHKNFKDFLFESGLTKREWLVKQIVEYERLLSK